MVQQYMKVFGGSAHDTCGCTVDKKMSYGAAVDKGVWRLSPPG